MLGMTWGFIRTTQKKFKQRPTDCASFDKINNN